MKKKNNINMNIISVDSAFSVRRRLLLLSALYSVIRESVNSETISVIHNNLKFITRMNNKKKY